MASLIPTLGLGRPGGVLAALGSGRTSLFSPSLPSNPAILIGADPGLRELVGADPSARRLTGADPALRTLDGADPLERILES